MYPQLFGFIFIVRPVELFCGCGKMSGTRGCLKGTNKNNLPLILVRLLVMGTLNIACW